MRRAAEASPPGQVTFSSTASREGVLSSREVGSSSSDPPTMSINQTGTVFHFNGQEFTPSGPNLWNGMAQTMGTPSVHLCARKSTRLVLKRAQQEAAVELAAAATCCVTSLHSHDNIMLSQVWAVKGEEEDPFCSAGDTAGGDFTAGLEQLLIPAGGKREEALPNMCGGGAAGKKRKYLIGLTRDQKKKRRMAGLRAAQRRYLLKRKSEVRGVENQRGNAM